MNANTKIIIIAIVVLAMVAGIAIFLNKDNIKSGIELNNNAIFVIMEDGREVKSYTMSEIQSLGEVEFEATTKSSKGDSTKHTYKGVLLKDIFADALISFEDKSSVVVTAADGYAVAVDMVKLLEDDNVYLAYLRNGELLGTKEDGGVGPYQMIISKDQFSQFWCKFALSADIK